MLPHPVQIFVSVVVLLLYTPRISQAAQTSPLPRRGAESPEGDPFLERIGALALPDYSQLLVRCQEAQIQGGNPLEDILKVRESPDPAAVPVLAEILSEYRGTGWVF